MSNESLDQFAKLKLDRLMTSGLRRSVTETHRTDSVHLRRDGRDLMSFCCNDYLGLTHHPKVKGAAAAAISNHGAGAGASRLITGNHPFYTVLEHKLASLKGTEAACVFGSGYMANVGILPALAGEDDLIVADELGHASIHMGARAARAKFLTFRHNDVDDLVNILARERASAGRCLVVTEGVFSMDGDRAPLDVLADISNNHDAWLMMDDAHGFGVLGGGRGSAFEFDPLPEIPLQMGTLSKAAGVYGAFLCASAPVIELMKSRARSLVYTTGLPPSVVAAAIAAVDIIATDPDRVARPLALARAFCNAVGLDMPESPVVPIIVGAETAALEASVALEEKGFLVTPIRPPTVPSGTSRLRFTFTAEHSEAQVEALAAAVNALEIDHRPPPRTAVG
ncbi:MAG: aminotransferase class I/II-fold pyridoxal phosphate-dependent enzyme [Pseudomonadota bacterium]|nr:aminotransferase class I/II-fold pyridoxal phosphate-dependent enzyme [Pseudomonadota bacterium]